MLIKLEKYAILVAITLWIAQKIEEIFLHYSNSIIWFSKDLFTSLMNESSSDTQPFCFTLTLLINVNENTNQPSG